MTEQPDFAWEVFRAINQRRRAIRHFDGAPVSEEVIAALVHEASLAPGSGNVQSYQFHWIRDRDLHARVARACNGQSAARTASALLVLTVHPRIGRQAMDKLAGHTGSLAPASRAYHAALAKKFRRVLQLAPLPLWTPLHLLLSAMLPSLSLLPMGGLAVRHWLARNAVYAAQTLMLAASARGLDSCPMEGFNAAAVARCLGLRRGTVIPVVIALGRRAGDARVEARWRKPLTDTLIIH